MPIKRIKSTGNARRHMTVLKMGTNKKQREKSLCFGISKKSGRNNRGVITAQNRGGGHKKIYRDVDFSQVKFLGESARVVAIEYDPNRTANIALIEYTSGIKSYILAPVGLKEGDNIVCDNETAVLTGNRMRLENIPASTEVYNIEFNPQQGGRIVKSAGSRATLLGFDQEFALLKLPSAEVRKIKKTCFASIGAVSGQDHNKVVIAKAGRFRLSGRRPHVRGKAKNPCDHPHGGGEGNVSIGMVRPKTPWGMPALGHKTRNKKKSSNEMIVRKRK